MSSSISVEKRSTVGHDDSPCGMTGIAKYSQALEAALVRPGEICWKGVEDMCNILGQREISSDEALSLLKPYVKNNMPTVVLKALTIIDALIVNCGHGIQARVASRKWAQRLALLAYASNPKVRYSVLQLFSNWAHKYSTSEMGEAYRHVTQELEERNLHIPSPLLAPEASPHTSDKDSSPSGSSDIETSSWDTALNRSGNKSEFVRGLDFLHLDLPMVPKLDSFAFRSKTEDLQQTKKDEDMSMTSDRIKTDVEKLVTSIQSCTEAAQALKAGKITKREVLDHLNKAWVAAEKCNVWSENMQSLLMRDLSEDDLAQLLEANDKLNSGLERWQALVSLDVANIGSAEDGEKVEDENTEGNVLSELGNLCLRRRTSTNTLSDLADRQMRQLREQNEILKRRLSEASAAKKAAMAQAEAQFKKQLKEVKHKGIRKMKELLAQISGLQEESKKMVQEREDAVGRLDSARQSLAKASLSADSEATRELKEEVVQLQRELEAEQERSAQREAAHQAEIKKLRNKLVDIEIQLAEKEGELEALTAESAAISAQNQANQEKLTNELQVLRSNSKEVVAFKERAEEAERMVGGFKLELKRESILRKKAYNQIREMKGNIRVLARVRPALVSDNPGSSGKPGVKSCLVECDDYTLMIEGKGYGHGNGITTPINRAFEFDACFGPGSTQEEVYLETLELIQSAFDGYNVCIFCYGQTGTGKTYTLTGDERHPGIIPRAMEDVFRTKSASEKCSVSAYMLELYQDTLIDLLGPEKHARLKTKTDPATGIVHVEGAKVCPATTSETLKKIFDSGLSKRKTAATALNIQSSRSHLIFTMLLERQNLITGARSRSKLSFVDLAGSERVARSGAVDDKNRLNEARAINKSLSALGDVVAALTSGESFIPYRNHKLTELMRDSLGGNAKTLMVVNVSPLASDSVETRNSLEYATRVKQVSNEASRSFETREIARLKALLVRNNIDYRQSRSSKSSPN